MAKAKEPKIRERYSIGETYGKGFESLAPAERFEGAKLAKTEFETRKLVGAMCPFQKDAKCIKKGGICSIRLYRQTGDGPVTATGPNITTCPQRFLESETIYSWIGEVLLGTKEPIILSQIGFLDRLRPPEKAEEEEDSRDFIGRIDNVLVHPTEKRIHWCAVELQAVYFSGNSMVNEFELMARTESQTLPFPVKNHRPDWRSSGPKRLLPQLQTKVPHIRTWGKKMAVVIDEAFFGSLVGLQSEKHLSNAEIVWFVVGYDPKPGGWTLVPRKPVFTRLDASEKALTGGIPLSQEKFEEQLIQKLAVFAPAHPLAVSKL